MLKSKKSIIIIITAQLVLSALAPGVAFAASTGSSSVTITGQLEDSSGDPVTTGEVIAIDSDGNGTPVKLDNSGSYSISVTAGEEYTLQYTQGIDSYPDDGIPDLYTIDKRSPSSDVDLGTIELPEAYNVDVTVETSSGTDVTDSAAIDVYHTNKNNGVESGFELLPNPIELAGQSSFTAVYDDKVAQTAITVNQAESVTLVTDNPADITGSQVFALSDSGQIQGWERGAYTLRTDDTDAATRITQPSVVNGEQLGDGNSFTDGNDGTNTKSLIREFDGDRNPMGVHQSGDDVTITFDQSLAQAGNQLDNQDNVELVAARVKPEDGAGAPASSEEALTLLSDIEKANKNASFEILDNSASLDGAGELTHTTSFSPGHYVIFAAVHGPDSDGIETGASSGNSGLADHNISVDGTVVLIGADQLSVQQGSTTVTGPGTPEAGDNLTFDIDTTSAFDSSDDGKVTHAVAVYNKSTFEDSRFDLVVDESKLGTDFSASDDAQLEHSINETNGIARVEDGTTLNGNDLADGEVGRPVSAGSAIGFFAEELNTDQPNTDPITAGGADNNNYEQIDASVTVVNGENRDAQVSVDTFDNFTNGKYQYVVVSTLDDNESQLSTTTGTIQLGDDSSSDDSSSDDSSSDDSSSDDSSSDDSSSDDSSSDDSSSDDSSSDDSSSDPIITDPEPDSETEPPAIRPEVTQANGTAVSTVGNLSTGQTVVLDINEGDTSENEGTAIERLNITSAGDASGVQVNVSTSQRPVAGTPDVARAQTVLRHIEVEVKNLEESEVSEGTFTFRVSQTRLENQGIAPESVVMYRFHNGSWNALETTHLGGNRFKADTPGFSSFAIGVAQPSVSVTDASLSTTEVNTGESVDVSAVVENSGDLEGNITLDVTADGTSVETREITVGADESVTETVSVTFDDTGSYQIAVNGVSAGTLSVTEAAAATDTGTETETDTETITNTETVPSTEPPGDDGGLPLIGIGIVIVLAALAAGAFFFRDRLLGV
ncbi:PGF-pre-PGF domain-containing protein [Haloarcula sp. 1CSR25-25]|uniref:PGF-pre-PGF domain-containing protein n=1 Tax=Haloarcula sp. 1CSR25-25 TaxID=2862545 RepID=UPI002893F070|nr:PGF-pre-PGF domain-containing protein [Haloarcula sp. 1CSR25-25]MDT3435584.1 PGF-pre-PGF domain-containing protein [Haloarcula sp. 1CSR25-25]